MSHTLNFNHEQEYWQQGIKRLAGLDEAGMGALAGPVVAAAVVFTSQIPTSPQGYAGRGTNHQSPITSPIRDSKTLSARQRDVSATWIKKHALSWAVGEATVAEITQLNIRSASHLAMRRAIAGLTSPPELVLIDGTPVKLHPTIPSVNVVDGDALVFSIAAASILAKVHRDSLMSRLDAAYPHYGWGSNKGYGSRLHLVALNARGPTPHHRPTYAPVAAVLTKNAQ